MSVYLTAARVLKEALLKKGTLKTLVYSSSEKDKRKLFALVCETLKHQKILTLILEDTELLTLYGWNEETSNQLYLAITLLYDFLYGKGLGKAGRIRSLITKHKRVVLSSFNKLKENNEIPEAKKTKNSVCLPRYIRVNTLKSTKEEIVERFQNEGWILRNDLIDSDNYYEALKNLNEEEFVEDPDIPNLLVFPPRTDFHSHYLNQSGAIILQDKASCFPAYVLNPVEGSKVIDSCAAPGNKTTHLAAIMNNTGSISAFDLSKERIKTLEEFIEKAGVENTTIRCNDFMKINPSIKGCEDVEYILVDPSCSGSGIAERRNDLTDDDHSITKKRLRKLSNFQSLLLQHALTFHSVHRVVYSTCSIHEEENERVVDEVLRKFGDSFELENILPEWKERGKEGYDCSDFCIRLNTANHMTNGFFLASFVSRNFQSDYSCTEQKSRKDAKECIENINEQSEPCELENGHIDEEMTSARKKSKKKKKSKERNRDSSERDLENGGEFCENQEADVKLKKHKKKKNKHNEQNLSENEIEDKSERKLSKRKKKKDTNLCESDILETSENEKPKKRKKKRKHSAETELSDESSVEEEVVKPKKKKLKDKDSEIKTTNCKKKKKHKKKHEGSDD
ncbi:hypothetical protein LOTGIDRAFT_132294 [Lottia gigantea]|uniref:SAM-dependent MTase RsmB/NOP-type domain-containing protein n=1 Tax=Lottia gigantea TaxID=225164 RepID=V3ZPI8_LOTGI|nr:hypothetical protein LOTGIDRAFT_132294 [Lottia gigantea]ESO84385.1 hypothetical protein LOTGIDRAFT_132294 [Lottia gigantea]